MPPRTLKEPLQTMQHQIIETMLAANGGKYPASHSDMAYCVQGLLKMYILDRRPLAVMLPFVDESGPTPAPADVATATCDHALAFPSESNWFCPDCLCLVPPRR